MQKRFDKIIGILGGAGPWASAHALQTMINRAQWDYNAVEDNEYPQIVLRSVPFDGFGAKGIESHDVVRGQVLDQFNRFAVDGVGVALIACNSLHTYYKDIVENTPQIDVVHLPREGAKNAAERGASHVGVLCSDSALHDNLHATALRECGVEPILPSQQQQETINTLIYRVMGGNSGADEARAFRKLSAEFGRAGAQVLLSGCTELSYLSHKFQSDIPAVDCLYVAINTVMAKAAHTSVKMP